MLKNAYLLAKIGADTAENEQHLAEILPRVQQRRRRAADPRRLLPALAVLRLSLDRFHFGELGVPLSPKEAIFLWGGGKFLFHKVETCVA